MPVKLTTTLNNLQLLENTANSKLIFEFYTYLKSNNTSESYQNQNIKALINFSKFLGPINQMPLKKNVGGNTVIDEGQLYL